MGARRKTHAEHLGASLVRRLLAAQFPQWADLPIRSVELDGWDNTTFRLGDNMSVRLPSHADYAAQVEKEHRWLPRLAPLLPLPIPVPLAKGDPSDDFPLPWSVYRWIEGEVAAVARIDDLTGFATALAGFLAALYQIDTADGPPAGPHSFNRGGSLTVYDSTSGTDPVWRRLGQTRDAIAVLGDRIDVDAVGEVWQAALAAEWRGEPVWVHGDVAATNLLVRNGCLSAVIDFGCSAVGDPACDLVIAWTFFAGESREAFRAGLPLDPGTWMRGRGWAMWKALMVMARNIGRPQPYGQPDAGDPAEVERQRHIIHEVLEDHSGARPVTPK